MVILLGIAGDLTAKNSEGRIVAVAGPATFDTFLAGRLLLVAFDLPDSIIGQSMTIARKQDTQRRKCYAVASLNELFGCG